MINKATTGMRPRITMKAMWPMEWLGLPLPRKAWHLVQ